MINGRKISGIIPIFNEGPHLKEVLDNIFKISVIDEFICINDGSTDNTGEILEEYRNKCEIISYGLNKGKGYAVACGLVESRGDIVILLDADILNYTERQIGDMVNPLVKGDADYTVRSVGLNAGRKISGIRAYWRKDIIHLLNRLMDSTKYGIEPILNEELRDKKVVYVRFLGSKHLAKYEKYPADKMVVEYWKEFLSLAEEVFRLQTKKIEGNSKKPLSGKLELKKKLRVRLKEIEDAFRDASSF
jgi:glycosyltransferase involved in cell wall biosynthesis